MKKQMLLTAAIISGILFSCTKEKIETQQTSESLQSTNSAQVVSESGLYINTLNLGLSGRFGFNGNLKDQTGKLVDGTAPIRGGALYTSDRNGNSNSALYLNGNYGVTLYDVPEQTNTSLTAWVKSGTSINHYFVTGAGPMFSQDAGKFWGVVGIPTVGTDMAAMGTVDFAWHHLAVTFDGTMIRVYRDGIQVASKSFVSGITPLLSKYLLGWRPEQTGYWKGAIDDLRFYGRTLSASEVQTLASM